MRNCKYVLALALLISYIPAKAQWIGGQISPREQQAFEQRVKEIGQFMQRFNNYEQSKSLSAATVPLADSVKQLQRTSSILHLLDFNKYSQSGVEEQEKVRSFIAQVNTNDEQAVYLDFYDDNWYAKVTLEAVFKGDAKELALVLKNESTADKVSKWVIVGAVADYLKLPAADPQLFLPPNSDGTNFLRLADALEAPQQATSYAYTGFEVDALTLFFVYLQSGILQTGRVKNVNFHFLQIEGWVMTVEEFNETQQYSSGWLISSLEPISDRATYKYTQLNIRPGQ